MKIYLKLLLAGLLAFALAMGCKKKSEEAETQKVAPESAGERGTSCDAKNDCGADLSCIAGICQPANFDISATVKECYVVDCQEARDCCGEKVTEAPAKCDSRTTYCSPVIPGCNAGFCSSDAECDGGVCGGFRTCNWTGGLCASNADCVLDTCISGGLGGVGGTCSISGGTCATDDDCFIDNTCGSGTCDCSNPDYDLTNPICTDPECEDICEYTCEDQRCVADDACESDDECFGTRDMCSDDGDCVECKGDSDCDDPTDEDDDEQVCDLDTGTCIEPCEGDAQCPAFHQCQAGSCEFVGCQSDRECILAGGGGVGDPRLAKCVQEGDFGVCRIECELDAHCNLDETCDEGTCKYIGCDDDAECKSILGLHNYATTDDMPWVPEGVCLEEAP